jgi:transposase InsO family protein
MDLHANSALSWSGRRELARRVVDQGWTLTAAAEAAGVSVRCARKWVGRYRAGDRQLRDRSSAPHRVANRTPAERVAVIVQLRWLRMTAAEIAETLAMPHSTVSAVLKRNGVGRLGRIGLEPAVRYERSRPGELVHIDVKKLGRFQAAGKRVGFRITQAGRPRRRDAQGHDRGITGWDYVHVAVDDYSRLAYAEVLADEKAITAVGFLRRARTFSARYGIQVERVLTDNGAAYISIAHAVACRQLGIRHLRTRPRRPQTNGKAERFIRTLLNGWAYGAIYRSSQDRAAALDGWLWPTTIDDHTQPSATKPRSAEPTCLGLTPRRRCRRGPIGPASWRIRFARVCRRARRFGSSQARSSGVTPRRRHSDGAQAAAIAARYRSTCVV